MAILSKPCAVLGTFLAILTPVFSAPLEKLNARQGSFYPITGPSVGGVQPRLELREVEADTEMYNLFLLSTIRFKEMDQDEKLSYFQISGIHGNPLIDWDNSPSNGGNPDFGYCPHGSNLFGPWHRPYLSVFEQLLSQTAVEIANEFPAGETKTRYQELANRLRLPYWDWAQRTASNEPIIPTAVTQSTVSVTFPNGTQSTVENPLLLYRFHPLEEDFFPVPWKNVTVTVRNSQPYSDVSDPEVTESNLQSFAPNIKETLYQIMTQWQTYNQFSNHGSDTGVLGNLESVHDMVHGAFGWSHMGMPALAAFDPVFWLHHANVDRLLAIWQKLYPDTYVEPYEQFWPGTWTIAPGSIQGADSPLTPFHRNAAGDYHTSETSRFTEPFQYTYPELQGNPSNDTLKARVNALYAPVTTSVSKRQEVPDVAISPEHPRVFIAAIESPLQIEGMFSVEIFLGDITTSAEEWLNDPNFVGAQTIMSRARNDQVIKGSVVLTEAIKKRFTEGKLESLETEDIVAYLEKNLKWRVQKGTEEVPEDQTSDFKVSVLSTEIKPAENKNDFPTYVGGWTDHAEFASR